MDGLTLLQQARAAGLTVRAEGGRLCIQGTLRAEALARQLLDHKTAVLAALPASPEKSAPAFAWDQAEAERLLAELREGLAQLERTWTGGTFPPVKANVLQIGVEVCEAYVRDHELEAARGWDALALLRDAVPRLLSLARAEATGESADTRTPVS